MSGRRTRVRALALGVAAGLSSPGCKSGDVLPGDISPATAGFQAATIPPGSQADSVRLRTASVNGGRIVLELVARDIGEPVAALAVKLSYPDSFSRFVSCTDGDAFPPGPCYSSEPAPGSGEVFLARNGGIGGPEVTITGDRVLLRIEFLVFGVDSGPIGFEAVNLAGGDATALLDGQGDPIPVAWFAGELRGL